MSEKNFSLETSVPLYLSNFCDSDCKICSMRRSNVKLLRKELSFREIKTQLEIIREIEKISSLMLLTGEYAPGRKRDTMLRKAAETAALAFEMGFERISLNIGSLSLEEISDLRAVIHKKNRPNLGLSVFQETYNRERYVHYFGQQDKQIPKSDFQYRYEACQRWLEAGFSRVNIGILFGVADMDEDMGELFAHYKLLKDMGGEVEISVPRVKGMSTGIRQVSDEEYIDAIKQISENCGEAKLIITTRESVELIEKVLPFVHIVSPGTSDVGAYTLSGPVPNHPDTSQFYIKSERDRPSWVLEELTRRCQITEIKYYGK